MTDLRSPKPAAASTKKAIEDFAASLPFDNGADAENVARGFIATRTDPIFLDLNHHHSKTLCGIFHVQISLMIHFQRQ